MSLVAETSPSLLPSGATKLLTDLLALLSPETGTWVATGSNHPLKYREVVPLSGVLREIQKEAKGTPFFFPPLFFCKTTNIPQLFGNFPEEGCLERMECLELASAWREFPLRGHPLEVWELAPSLLLESGKLPVWLKAKPPDTTIRSLVWLPTKVDDDLLCAWSNPVF